MCDMCEELFIPGKAEYKVDIWSHTDWCLMLCT